MYYVGKECRLLHVYMHTIIKIILYIAGHVAKKMCYCKLHLVLHHVNMLWKTISLYRHEVIACHH